MVDGWDAKALQAHRMWAKAMGKNEGYTSLIEFAEFLDDPVIWRDGRTTRDKIISQDNPVVKDIIEKLTGPNGYTMMKVLLARKGYNHEGVKSEDK